MDNIINNTPATASRSKIQDFFLYLFCIIGLYVSAIGFINLVFAIIEKYFGDVLFDFNSSTGAKVAIACLVIFFPIFVWLSKVINKSIKNFPDGANYIIRKILYYFTLFIAGLTIAVDLVTLIFYYLDGEISIRFVLKVLTVLLVGGLIFWHYLYDLRRDLTQVTSRPKITVLVVSVIVIITLIFGIIISGSPMQARNKKFDDQKINDLSSIQNSVTEYYRTNNNILPKNLLTLSQSTNYSGYKTKDPELNIDYEYNVISQNQYRLCANFSTDNTNLKSNEMNYPVTEIWKHGIGRVCFDRVAGEILVPGKIINPL